MKYFQDIGVFGLPATCRNCGVITHFNGKSRYRIEENGINLVVYTHEYQCQDCGELRMSGDGDDKQGIEPLEGRCSCGGQFRRDKPLFCKGCKVNKSADNKSEK